MKNFWKVLGIAALAVGLTPYKVEKDEETGENKYQALLWQATRTKKDEGDEKGELNITLGFNSPFEQDEEAHLFSDDLSVEYVIPKTESAEMKSEAAAEEQTAAADMEAEAAAEEQAAAEEDTTEVEKTAESD